MKESQSGDRQELFREEAIRIASTIIGRTQVAVLATTKSWLRKVFFGVCITHQGVGIDLIESAQLDTHEWNLKFQHRFFKFYL